MAQYFKDIVGPVYAVIVDEERDGRYKMANHNTEERGRSVAERCAAMKRLYQKMVEQYPEADVDLVQIIALDADRVSGGNEDPGSMSRLALEQEVLRLRRKVASRPVR